MAQLMARIGQELPLILAVGAGVVLFAVALTVWRIRHGARWTAALVTSALEAGIAGGLTGIAALTLGPFGSAGPGPADLVPFQSLVESFRFGRFWTELVLIDWAANILLYLPLGLLLALRFPRLSLWVGLLATSALAAGIELIQAVVLNRSADINDVLMNAVGGLAGLAVGRAVHWLRRAASGRMAVADRSGSS